MRRNCVRSLPHRINVVGDLCVQPGDKFGSPNSEDLGMFVQEFNRQFEAAVGADLAGDVQVEVSSPVRTYRFC